MAKSAKMLAECVDQDGVVHQYDLEELIAKAKATGQAQLTPCGAEVLDPTPIAPPVGFVEGPSLIDQIRSMVVAQQLQLQDDQQVDDLQESADFDMPELDEPWTRSEIEGLDPLDVVREAVRRGIVKPATADQLAEYDAKRASKPPNPIPPASAEGGGAGGSPKKPPESPPGGGAGST